MKRAVLLATGLSLVLAAPPVARAGNMLQTYETIAVPKDGEAIPCRSLVYKAWFTAALNSVRLDPLPAEGADPAVGEWIFTGSNTDGQMHRVAISITLLDEKGATVATLRGGSALAPGAREQRIPVKMKVPAKAWAEARAVRLNADWFS